MKWQHMNLQTRLYLIAAVILLVGLGSALLIYLTADTESDSTLIHDFENSKKYNRELELYGGKANVMADKLWRWFDGLWHGESLAYTVAGISILLSLGFSFFAYHTPPDIQTADTPENGRNGPA